jgi:hypothetical protein
MSEPTERIVLISLRSQSAFGPELADLLEESAARAFAKLADELSAAAVEDFPELEPAIVRSRLLSGMAAAWEAAA